ncbi:MAG TPA: TRAP transporter small permease subunit [Polyangiaceae bacterium]
MLSYRRVDEAIARVESAVAVGVLVAMVLVASLQALFFNIAERNVGWAQSMLESLDWADAFLQKGTLWLAFIGASLATYHDKHIAIDVLPRLVAPPVRRVMQIVALTGAGAVAFLLAKVFYDACLVADQSVPFEYEVLTSQGPEHVCDAAPAELGTATAPMLLCGVRSAFAAIGVPVTSGGGAAQLITPLMFVVIGMRLWARAVIAGLTPPRDEAAIGALQPVASESSEPESSEPDPNKAESSKPESQPDAAAIQGDDDDGEDDGATSGKKADES